MQLLVVRTILNYLKVIIVWNKFPLGMIKIGFEKKRSFLYLWVC